MGKDNKLHIILLGRRNSGKSSLINALTGQNIAIVSDVGIDGLVGIVYCLQ